MKSHQTVATRCILFHESGGCGADVVGITVPDKAIASVLSVDASIAIVDSEVERVDIGADGTGLVVVVGVGTGSGVVRTVPTIAVASGDMIGSVLMNADGEV